MVERTSQMNMSADDPRAIEARIERTRMEMAETVDEIQERLSPDRLKLEAQQMVREATIGKMEEMADMARYKVRTWRSDVVDTIKSNPVPAALAGLGIGWLIMSGSKEDHHLREREFDYSRGYGGRRYTPSYQEEWAPGTSRYTGVEQDQNLGQRIGDTAEDLRWQAQQKANEARWQAQETAEEVRMRAQQMADQARARAEELGEDAQQFVDDAGQQLETWGREARQQARSASRGLQELMHENPLAVGAMALVIGAAIGLSLPSTEVENELMGDTRDRVIDEARATAGETMEKVRHVAEEAKDSAEKAIGDVEQSTKQAATEVKETAKTEAQKQDLTTASGDTFRSGKA